jgi:hypothetical protein
MILPRWKLIYYIIAKIMLYHTPVLGQIHLPAKSGMDTKEAEAGITE